MKVRKLSSTSSYLILKQFSMTPSSSRSVDVIKFSIFNLRVFFKLVTSIGENGRLNGLCAKVNEERNLCQCKLPLRSQYGVSLIDSAYHGNLCVTYVSTIMIITSWMTTLNDLVKFMLVLNRFP